ncbi:hypothetical protein TNCV_1343101 [Trichonephila clavipes]|nr:hypothetical protein TNCV_1343101 [Trichonephila clavipes]
MSMCPEGSSLKLRHRLMDASPSDPVLRFICLHPPWSPTRGGSPPVIWHASGTALTSEVALRYSITGSRYDPPVYPRLDKSGEERGRRKKKRARKDEGGRFRKRRGESRSFLFRDADQECKTRIRKNALRTGRRQAVERATSKRGYHTG